MSAHPAPLVSIVIPAYKAVYFEIALQSALAQAWPALEIVIGDDSADQAIADIVQRYQDGPVPIRYQRNPEPLGEVGNLARCIEQARGTYIKPLYDDDVLQPGCVPALVSVLQQQPEVALAAVRRRRIGPDGEVLEPIVHTVPVFGEDVVLEGPPLVAWLAEQRLNFIGEPSCIMARRSDLQPLGDGLMSLDGVLIEWLGDLALYCNLLQHGSLALLDAPLCDFRVSPQQFSQAGRDQPGIGEHSHSQFSSGLRALGWCDPAYDGQHVQVRCLGDGVVEQVDLLTRLRQVFASLNASAEVQAWLARRVPDHTEQGLIDAYLHARDGGPRLAVYLLSDGCQPGALAATLRSLEQAREHYPALAVQVIEHAVGAQRVGLLNQALGQCSSTWCMLAAAGDEFTPAGLMIAGLELAAQPACHALYGDSVRRLADGQLRHAMRPDFSLDYLLSCPRGMLGHWLFKREVVLQEGGFAAQFDRALEWEMILRLIDQRGAAGIGHVSEVWAIVADVPAVHQPQQQRALLRHLQRRGYADAQVHSPGPGLFAIDYWHAAAASVSILVVPGTQPAALERCLLSVVEHSRGSDFEVLVAIEPRLPAASRQWLLACATLPGAQLRCVELPAGLSHSAACNRLAAQAQGEYLLLLRSEAAAMHSGWLEALLNHAQRPEVGVVGALALDAEGHVVHAGTLLGLQGAAGGALQGWPLAHEGYGQRLRVEHNYSAVGGACLMVRASLYGELAGLDEQFADAGSDTDLCLRAGELGYLTVWTPRARLLYSVPPAELPPLAQQALRQRWLERLARDPAHNPNLSLNRAGGFELADANLSWRPLVWRPLPVILAQPADFAGCGQYRVIQPLRSLKNAGLAEGVLGGGMTLLDVQRYAPDSIILQRPISASRLEALGQLHEFSQAFKVYELDDYLPRVPIKNVHRAQIPKDVLRTIARGLAWVDRFVVSTQPLAEAFGHLHGDIRVVENRLDPAWWDQLPAPAVRAGGKPRVGWGGGISHSGDLDMIGDVVRALAGEVDWVFFGMCPPALRPFLKEYHPGVPIAKYPAKLASLGLDLAIAPLEENLFNTCKSNLRLLELGICGYPVVCSDVPSFACNLPVTRVRNRFKDWVAAIRGQLADPAANALAGVRLQAAVREHWMLDAGHRQTWLKAWLPD